MLKANNTFLFPKSHFSVNENPQLGYNEHEQSPPSQPWQVLCSEGFECEKFIINSKVKPWLFHCSVSTIFLVEAFEWLCNFWVNNVVLWPSVSVGLDFSSGGELTCRVSRWATVAVNTVWDISWKTSLVSTELVNVHFLSDQLISIKYYL